MLQVSNLPITDFILFLQSDGQWESLVPLTAARMCNNCRVRSVRSMCIETQEHVSMSNDGMQESVYM